MPADVLNVPFRRLPSQDKRNAFLRNTPNDLVHGAGQSGTLYRSLANLTLNFRGGLTLAVTEIEHMITSILLRLDRCQC